jgi:hypothetical protein
MKYAMACVCLTIALLAVPGSRAQGQKELPAPLPAQIFTATKIFLSNAGGDTLGEYSGGSERAYNQLYAGLKGLGRYELVTAPADAELVFEISFTIPTVGENVSGGGPGHTSVSNRTVRDPHLRLAILDLKTHVLLWTFTEHVQPALLQGNRDKNFDQAMAVLVNDIRNVAGQPVRAASSK